MLFRENGRLSAVEDFKLLRHDTVKHVQWSDVAP